MEIRRFLSLGAAALIAGALPGMANADPAGLWRAADGGTTRISPCGAALCGYIVSTNPSVDPATGLLVTDRNNFDRSKRTRTLVGIPVLIGMQPDGPGHWSGQLYDPSRGQNFPGHLIELNANTVRVEGCALGICGGENLSRVR
jgi:uncharacterized protein (DUF2147 family)